MKINSIEIKNYRNYEAQQVDLSDGINVIIGKNAQGKTNLLEAIFLCAVGKSARTSKDKDLIKWNTDLASINLNFTKKSGNRKINIFLQSTQNKTIKINNMPIHRIGELMGEFNAIYFSPDELKLVKESPDERRRFMDISLSQFNKNYFYTLSKYNKILLQRNKLLKTAQDKKTLQDTLSIWNEQLATCGEFIIKHRLALMEKLKVYAFEALQALTNKKERLKLEYSNSYTKFSDTIKNSLIKSYEDNLDKDLKLGYTTVGPHRDDFKIMIDDIDVRYFGSQGQQRTCALALKLAELEIFKDLIGEYPVLLLDDVLSELDNSRQLQLLEKVKNIQTIITGTHFNFNIPHVKYTVDKGKIIKVEKLNQ